MSNFGYDHKTFAISYVIIENNQEILYIKSLARSKINKVLKVWHRHWCIIYVCILTQANINVLRQHKDWLFLGSARKILKKITFIQ